MALGGGVALPAVVARSPLMSWTAVKAFSRDCLGGGVDGGYFLLDAEPVLGKARGRR